MRIEFKGFVFERYARGYFYVCVPHVLEALIDPVKRLRLVDWLALNDPTQKRARHAHKASPRASEEYYY